MNTVQLNTIKDKRWRNFIMRDGDPYICYRFVVALEKLMPHDLSQLKIEPRKENEYPDTTDRIVIEKEPEQVYKRYIYPLYEPPYIALIDHARMEKIRELVGMYCRYLRSSQLDRLYYYSENKDKWEQFI